MPNGTEDMAALPDGEGAGEAGTVDAGAGEGLEEPDGAREAEGLATALAEAVPGVEAALQPARRTAAAMAERAADLDRPDREQIPMMES